MNTSLPSTPRFESKTHHHSEPKRSSHRPTKSFSTVLDEVGEELFGKNEDKDVERAEPPFSPIAKVLQQAEDLTRNDKKVSDSIAAAAEEKLLEKPKIKQAVSVESAAPFFVATKASFTESAQGVQKLSLVATPVDFTQYFVELITACDLVDKVEYSFQLDSERFVGTPFYGMKIVVHEYQHAPKIFNIQLIASDAACQLLAAHMPGIRQAFSNQTKFKVHLLETELLDEKSSTGAFAQKVKSSHEKEDFPA